MTDKYQGKPYPGTPTHVKLGTQSTLVFFHPDDELAVNTLVRYKEGPTWEPWQPWHTAWIHDLNPLPFLEKM